MTNDWRRGFAIALLVGVAMTARAQPLALDRHVRVSQGEIAGADRNADGVLAFKGIPHPPIASRFTEAPFVFGALAPEFIVGARTSPAESDRKLSDPTMRYWVNFAGRGDPDGPALPSWPGFGEREIVLNLASDIAPIVNPTEAKFRFLAKFGKAGVLQARWRDAPSCPSISSSNRRRRADRITTIMGGLSNAR